jgi:hypothetical protein
LSASLLKESAQPGLVKALCAASRLRQIELHMNKGLAGAGEAARNAARQTATNPAVLEAFTLAIIAGGEAPAYLGLPRTPMDLPAAHAAAHAIDLAAAEPPGGVVPL